jgi:hypothetical protein
VGGADNGIVPQHRPFPKRKLEQKAPAQSKLASAPGTSIKQVSADPRVGGEAPAAADRSCSRSSWLPASEQR